jgi:hypothetical protein
VILSGGYHLSQNFFKRGRRIPDNISKSFQANFYRFKGLSPLFISSIHLSKSIHFLFYEVTGVYELNELNIIYHQNNRVSMREKERLYYGWIVIMVSPFILPYQRHHQSRLTCQYGLAHHPTSHQALPDKPKRFLALSSNIFFLIEAGTSIFSTDSIVCLTNLEPSSLSKGISVPKRMWSGPKKS